jgi:response regulator RpfG family c-di-GMP phosphodiesterase
MSQQILLVDDDANVLAGFQRTLRKQFSIDTAASGAQALAKLKSEGPYAVVVADMQMPNMNGVEFLQQAEAQSPDTVRIMLTGNADQTTAVDAVNQGHIFRFLNKPCPSATITLALEAGLKQHSLVIAERELLEKTLNGAVKILTDVLAAVDSQSFGRARQLQDYMKTVLQSFKVSQSWELEAAAMLTSVGRVTLPPAVVMKERSGLSLGAAENDMLLRVPEIGAELLEQIPRLENVAKIVRFQNKNFDGSGFPAGGGGDDIPIGARILKVLSNLAELEFRGFSKTAALLQMQQTEGRYDPQVVGAISRCFDVALPQADDETLPAVSVAVQDLRVGQILAADVQTIDSLLVVVAGVTLSSMLVERLRNFRALGTIANNVMVRVNEPTPRPAVH